MHQVTKSDIVISVGRGLLMAAAIVGATYYLGSWYLGGDGLEALYDVDGKVASRFEHPIVPVMATEVSR